MKMDITTLSVEPMKINKYVEYHELNITQKRFLNDINIKFKFHQNCSLYPDFKVNILCKIKRRFFKNPLSSGGRDILSPSLTTTPIIINMVMSEPFPILYDANLYKMILKWIDNMNYKIISDRRIISKIRVNDNDLDKILEACSNIAFHMNKINM